MQQREGNPLQLAQREERRLSDLYRGKKQLVDQIKQLNRQQRMLSDSKQHSLQAQRNARTARVSEVTPSKQPEHIPQHHPHLDTQQEQIKKAVEAQGAIKDRNKRLFGGLNNHLKKASTNLQSESQKVKQKQSIEDKVIQKEKSQTLEFEEKKRQSIKQSLEDLNNRKQANAKEILQSENVILKNKFVAYVSDLQHSLFTKTSPSLAWKPKIINEQLSELISQSQQAVQAKTSSIIQLITSYNEVFDYNKYVFENERQYYRNYLESYFTSKQSFLITKTKPHLLWLPYQSHERLSDYAQLTKATLAEECKNVAEENDGYYKKFEKEETQNGRDQENHEEHSDVESQSEH